MEIKRFSILDIQIIILDSTSAIMKIIGNLTTYVKVKLQNFAEDIGTIEFVSFASKKAWKKQKEKKGKVREGTLTPTEFFWSQMEAAA